MESANGKNHEHLSGRELNAYAARQLSPAETLLADEHLAICDACHEKLSSLLAKTDRPSELNFAFSDLFSAASDDAHLSYEDQLEPYVNGILSELDSLKVEDHLQNCRMCSAEVQDLQRFRIRLEQFEKTTEPEIKSVRKGFFGMPTIFARNLPQTGLVFGALIILLLAGTFILVKWRTDEAVEITRVTNDNSRSNQNSSLIAPNDANVPKKPDSAPANSIQVSNTNLTNGKLPAQANKPDAPAETAEPLPREVETALSSGALVKPKVLEEVAGNPVQLLGDKDKTESFALESPEFVTLRARPVFRWQPLAGASGYTVTVFDSNLKRVVKSENLTTNQWTPSSKLKLGEVYQWQVTAVKDGKPITAPAAPAPEAKFKILGLKESGRLQAALAKAGKSNLARGVLYAQAGLLGDAEREFQAEINRNSQAKTARRLLGQIRLWRNNK